eukprot:SAG11_NODE_186_length_13142_cov_17.515679_5_plen_58_part_00
MFFYIPWYASYRSFTRNSWWSKKADFIFSIQPPARVGLGAFSVPLLLLNLVPATNGL